MKNGVGIAAGVMASLLVVGPAAAVDYQGTASFNGDWLIQWPMDASSCANEIVSQAFGAPSEQTIDGITHSAVVRSLNAGGTAQIWFASGLPNGTFTKATVNGADHLTCGVDRLMLPGAIVTPAAVPTLSEWAMIVLGVMLAGGAALFIQRRRQTA